ncbi:MAG: M28 family peptidase [Spirochaetales bacterium]|nr:M28 family peptidase [Spirochaetales bacterium]
MSVEKEYAAALVEFTKPECDRFGYLKRFLSSRGLAFGLIPAGEDRFVHMVTKGPGDGRPMVLRPIFTAHVDRAPGSPGANDNSAAVLALLFFAAARSGRPGKPVCEALFTDSEEAGSGASPKTQGSFRLAEYLKKKNFGSRVFYNFDMCGRGDAIVVSEAGERFLEGRKKTGTALYRRLRGLRTLVLDGLGREFGGGIMSLPTPFSDNLGFLLQGFPALQFTFLPRREALAYRREHRRLTDEIASSAGRVPDAAFRARFAEIQPETWRLRHTERDTVESLTPQTLPLLLRLFESLARLGVPEG